MNYRSYGVLLRVYTPKLDEVEDRAERAVRHYRHILATGYEFPPLRYVTIMVPRDYDCGETVWALKRKVRDLHTETASGHHSCEVLNRGLDAMSGEVSHALIVSGKAIDYLTPAAMRAIDQAFADGAFVAGLAVDELRDIVLSGRVQNTFAAWDIDKLRSIGGFDSKDGVEEIAPIARLGEKYGQCIAPLDATGSALDIAPSETARARHLEVMTTKLSRQQAEVERVGSSFGLIKASILPGYPRHV